MCAPLLTYKLPYIPEYICKQQWLREKEREEETREMENEQARRIFFLSFFYNRKKLKIN